jgi:hypothetical protein
MWFTFLQLNIFVFGKNFWFVCGIFPATVTPPPPTHTHMRALTDVFDTDLTQ